SVSSKWKIQDGVLTLSGRGGGDIITKEEYGAFEFTVDYRISKGGNSGLMFHVKETESSP
ncbi:MAG TPA: DUF1080 domain-containing protein, partial [Verrucomicrobiales bacterium]|nr:DUF1080 domain-containing protein [Verrucomicrobiales bacterium]